MTLQDLKNKKNEIVTRISEIGNKTFTKEIMTAMLRMVEADMAESSDAISLVDEVIEMNKAWQKVETSTLWGAGCKYSTQAEYQRACLGNKFN